MSEQRTGFPDAVREALVTTGSAITCLPVQMDGADWESAIFFQLRGPECEADTRRLRSARTVPVALDTEVIEHEHAALAVLRFELYPDTPVALAGEILLVPGANKTHFETLELLTRQPRLGCFVADDGFRVILSQFVQLGDAEHEEFRDMLDKCTRHDAVVRLTGRYDADAAFAAVTSHYALREDAP